MDFWNYIKTAVDFYWGWVFVPALILLILYTNYATKFLIFRRFGMMLDCLKPERSNKQDSEADKKAAISPVTTLIISIGGVVGSGNLIGVAVAIFRGGAGAVFWMWVLAILGTAVSMVENTLGQLYKKQLPDKSFAGGSPAYISAAWNSKALTMAYVLALATAYWSLNALQSGQVIAQIDLLFPKEVEWDTYVAAAILAVITAFVIIGGIRSIAAVANWLVPIMCFTYIAIALFICLKNYYLVPGTISTIVSSAFGYDEVTGGVVGHVVKTAMIWGARRGILSSEVGTGAIPIVSSNSVVSHPSRSGLIQMIAILSDSLICTASGIIILTAGYNFADPVQMAEVGGATGEVLLANALNTHLGYYAFYFMAFVTTLFAFTSILGNYAVGSGALKYCFGLKALPFYQIVNILGIILVATVGLAGAFDLIDLLLGISTGINFIGMLPLLSKAFSLLEDYEKQYDAGDNTPTYKKGRWYLENK